MRIILNNALSGKKGRLFSSSSVYDRELKKQVRHARLDSIFIRGRERQSPNRIGLVLVLVLIVVLVT